MMAAHRLDCNTPRRGKESTAVIITAHHAQRACTLLLQLLHRIAHQGNNCPAASTKLRQWPIRPWTESILTSVPRTTKIVVPAYPFAAGFRVALCVCCHGDRSAGTNPKCQSCLPAPHYCSATLHACASANPLIETLPGVMCRFSRQDG